MMTGMVEVADVTAVDVEAVVADSREERDYVVDILDVIEGISSHFHEHHDTIVNWSWKLFCAKWARLLDQVSIREAERLAKEEARKEDQMLRDLMAANRARVGLD